MSGGTYLIVIDMRIITGDRWPSMQSDLGARFIMPSKSHDCPLVKKPGVCETKRVPVILCFQSSILKTSSN